MRPIALGLLWALLASAQPAEPEEEFSTVSGRVVDGVTGEPVTKARLRLMSARERGGRIGFVESGPRYGAISDDKGLFEIPNVEPGRYRLFASRSGFVDFEYGGSEPQLAGALLDIQAPQLLDGLELRLVPHGVITGQVVDSDGEPVGDSRVYPLRLQYVNGVKALTLTGKSGLADDRGQYRIYGLTSGRYYLYATPEDAGGWFLTSSASQDAVPVYYPGVQDRAGAAAMSVEAGTEVRADFVLPIENTVAVRGRVAVEISNIDGLPSVSFTRMPFHGSPGVTTPTPTHNARVNDQGEFEVLDLTPGTYRATAFLREGNNAYGGRVLVNVAGSEMEGIVIPIAARRSVGGKLAVEEETAAPLRPSIRLTPISSLWGLNSTQRRISEDGSFRLTGLDATGYALSVGLPDGFYVRAIQVDGVDQPRAVIDLTSGSIEDVDILVSPNAGAVAGAVRDGNSGEASFGAVVILVPLDQSQAQIPWQYPQTTTDQYGRFEIPSVPPGEYRAYAWEQVESTAWMNDEFMRPLRTKGKALSVEENSEVGVQLEVIPAQLE